MKYLFYLGHPAHFHLFRNVIETLKLHGHQVTVLIKKKDILEELLQRSGLEYFNILPEGRKDSKMGIAVGLIKRDLRLLKFVVRRRSTASVEEQWPSDKQSNFNGNKNQKLKARSQKPDIMIGTSTEISHIGKLLGIPSINMNEDDAAVVPLYSKLSYPWASVILSPVSCYNGKWERKTVKYPGYHELAYLHPDHFTPDRSVVEKYFAADKPYFIIRFAKLTAHHDSGVRGLHTGLAEEIINILKPFGKICITSERQLEPQFESYRMSIDPLDIHHIMAYASLYIGDSQTMAAEAGVLGIPFIRYNDFVGRIGYLRELEEFYGLGFGFRPDQAGEMLAKIRELAGGIVSHGEKEAVTDKLENLKEEWKIKRQKMLSERINTANFLVEFIENYKK